MKKKKEYEEAVKYFNNKPLKATKKMM